METTQATTNREDGMSLRNRLATFLLVLATTAGATFTILIAPGSGSIESLPVRVVYDFMAAMALIPWLAVAIVRPGWRPSSRLLPAIAVILVGFVISSVTSRVPRLSFEMLGYAILLAEVYLLLVTLMRRPAIRAHFERLALLLCFLACGLYLLQVSLAWIDWWGLVGRLTIPPLRPGYLGLLFGSPNPVATLVMLLGAFGLAASRLVGRPGRAVAGVLIVLVVVATFITASRGAWLGAVAGLAGTIGIAVVARSEYLSRARSLLRSRSGAIAMVGGAPLAVGAGILLALSGRLNLDDNGARAAFARVSLQLFDSSPLTGVGPGTWATLRAANSLPTDPDQYIPHAHNMFLQTLAEFGLVGIVAAAVLMGALAVLIVRAIRSDDVVRRRVALAALFGVILFAVQQLADVLVNVPALLLAVALPVAWLDAAAPPAAQENGERVVRQTPLRSRVVPLGALLVTGAVLIGLIRVETITAVADRGVAAANAGAWADAAARFGQAVATDPDVNVYQFELGVSAANSEDLGLAETSLSRSATADSYHYAWLDLAAVRWQLGDVPGAREALDRAERLGLQRTSVAIAAGWLHQQLGDDQAAIDDYALAVLQTPTLADDPFWSSSSGPPGGQASLVEALEQRGDPATLLRAYLVLGRFDQARAAIATLGNSQPGVFGSLTPAWQGDPAAWATLQAEAMNRPFDVTTVAWCRFVAEHRGDQASAQQYGQWLAVLGGPDWAFPAPDRIVLGSGGPLPPHNLDRYGSLYRRDVVAAQVVGILPQLVWQDRP